MTARLLAAAFAPVALLLLCGCGERFAEVSGQVTLDGKPLEAGVVTFFPDAGTPVAATVQNGSYTATQVPYGRVRVAVTPQAAELQVTAGPGGPVKPGQEDPAAKQRPAPAPKKPPGPTIPDQFRSVDTSGLSTTVEKEKVTFPIELK